MNNTSEKFKKYLEEYLKKSNWETKLNGQNHEPYISIKYTTGKVFGYVDYYKNIIHIPEISNNEHLKNVSYSLFAKSTLTRLWNCDQIEIAITSESKFLDYLKLLELACKKINNRI